MRTLISFDDARSIILAAAPLQPVETARLHDARGRTLAEPVVSTDAIPPFDNSAMDGYAVRTGDLDEVPARLTVTGEIPAGTMPERAVTSGTCQEIMTGAPMPDGADAVVPVEWTERDAGEVIVRRAPDPGQYVRPAGQDVADGERMFDAGTVVTPPVVGMLATLGRGEVPVRQAPRVAVISTGDELVDASESLGPGQIRDANGPALTAQVAHAGGIPLGPFRARDTAASVRQVVTEALRDADVLVLSGGVSMGRRDVVRDVLESMGFEAAFWKVKQRPGKPLTFGTIGGVPVFGLPGNPVSSTMCFEQHVRPVLAAMLGRTEVTRPTYRAVLDAPTAKVEALHHFTRGVVWTGDDGRLRTRDTGNQQSNLYASVVRATCTVHLPAGRPDARAGTDVDVELLPWT